MNCSALILAGGQSSRMGQDKALIPVNGVPMLTHVCQVALACVDSVRIITPWPERYRAIAPADCEFIQEVALPVALSEADAASGKPSEMSQFHPPSDPTEPLFNHGPLVGFAQGLRHVTTEWVLLLACDLPQLKAELIQSWLPLLPHVPEAAIALLAHPAKGWEPLCGFYRSSCLNSLEVYISSGQRSFQSWLNQTTVSPLPHFDEGVLFNCNTPVDLREIQKPSRS